MENRVLEFIKLLKGETPEEKSCVIGNETITFNEYETASDITEEIFLKGDCTRFGCIMKFVFPDGKILYSDKHECDCVFEYDNHFYNITGDVTEKYKDIINDFNEVTIEQAKIETITYANYNFIERGPNA